MIFVSLTYPRFDLHASKTKGAETFDHGRECQDER